MAYLIEHNIQFCMRCEKSSGGWAAVRAFERSDQVDAIVTLNKPNKWDCEDYGFHFHKLRSKHCDYYLFNNCIDGTNY